MSNEETDYSLPSSILFLNAGWKFCTNAQKHKGKNTLKLIRSQKCITDASSKEACVGSKSSLKNHLATFLTLIFYYIHFTGNVAVLNSKYYTLVILQLNNFKSIYMKNYWICVPGTI